MHDHAHDDETHFSLRGYLAGFAAAAVLTAIPFWLVLSRPLASTLITSALLVFLAVAQIMVHTFALLHVNAKAQGGWTLVAYVFTAVLVVITIGGSMWIMHHLNLNMMPGMMDATTDYRL